ncbi:DinB family protein [Winogradskyella endarachnes]|uniref:DUF1572 domain-containing protein n=1 Tax=Winogradskyella endarachnes TaxID=2681965 RepID=A0A6L6UCE2_9FLAO|nr:DinB family protein [Winogradskyella endarachnes]MUU78434.1 DUF1572 domain-containing protein [Winogradskyella endarachnes]
MLTKTLIKIFTRDLEKIKEEISLYKDEKNLWKIDGLVTNSSGTLVLHLLANLNHFIGAILGDSGYVRDRDLEFSLRDIPKSELLSELNKTIRIVENTLNKITPNMLQKDYKPQVFKDPMTIGYFLVHLASHLAYHLGQINYHRRLLDK